MRAGPLGMDEASQVRGDRQAKAGPPAIRLPRPRLTRSTSCAKAFRLRKTEREISDKPLGAQRLSDLLFAARGVNRRHGPFGGCGLTAASASNSQEVDLYVALRDGAFRFSSERHALEPVVAQDIRRLAYGPHQPSRSLDAPGPPRIRRRHRQAGAHVRLRGARSSRSGSAKSYYFVDTALIAGNVYLFAAARGLACWFHNCDRVALAKKLKLRRTQRVLFAQTVGFPATRRR